MLNGVGALPYEFVVAAFVVGWSVGWLERRGAGAAVLVLYLLVPVMAGVSSYYLVSGAN